MHNVTRLFSITLLSLGSMLSIIQPASANDDQTLLLTLQYQQDAFQVVHSRLLNEHLPKRHTIISNRDDLSFNGSQQNNVEQDVVDTILRDVNSNPKYQGKKMRGTSIIVRHPYQDKGHVISNPVQYMSHENQTANQETIRNEDINNEELAQLNAAPREPDSLPEQLILSPNIGDQTKRPLYSDLL